MASPLDNDRSSILLVEECFRAEDGRFLEALRRVHSIGFLAAFADRWKRDPRLWARAQIFRYLELPMDSFGHEPVVKRLFKAAEERKDDELMGAFLAAFDTLIRRVRKKFWRWDSATRSAWDGEHLVCPRDIIPLAPKLHEAAHLEIDRSSNRKAARASQGFRLFSNLTRQYLRRRAARYFRRIGYSAPDAYPAALAKALLHYRDADLTTGERILDSWGLLNLCFRNSEILEFRPTRIELKDSRSLSELRAAPRFPERWKTSEAGRVLLNLAGRAPARLVRMWAMDLFRTSGAPESLEVSADELIALLDHADEQVQQFGSELFSSRKGLEKLPLSTWLRLLETRNVTALAAICEAFTQNVNSDRLTFEQCISLACSEAAPAARLGLDLLKARKIRGAETVALAGLADARCAVCAAEITAWALARLGTAEHYQTDVVLRFFDSLTREVREAAWTWLSAGGPGHDDPVLWSRLTETPFDELRLKLVDRLAVRASLAPSFGDLTPVWCAVLLGVHRGGRQKLKAVRQVAEVIAAAPESAATLLSVLVVAVRSVRGPEMRAGLAAVMTLIARRPELAEAIRRQLPELTFEPVETAA